MKTAIVAMALTTALSSAACTQFPTEKSQVADLRPQISFKLVGSDSRLLAARVFVNGLDSGTVGDFVDGQASLKVLTGSNRVLIIQGDRRIIDERVYLGDGVSRAFIVN